MAKAVALYPGSFDPVTRGHLDIIRRISKTMEHVTVAVLDNPRKQAVFSIDERVEMLRRVTQAYKNVTVDYYNGLLVDYAREKILVLLLKVCAQSPILNLNFKWPL